MRDPSQNALLNRERRLESWDMLVKTGNGRWNQGILGDVVADRVRDRNELDTSVERQVRKRGGRPMSFL